MKKGRLRKQAAQVREFWKKRPKKAHRTPSSIRARSQRMDAPSHHDDNDPQQHEARRSAAIERDAPERPAGLEAAGERGGKHDQEREGEHQDTMVRGCDLRTIATSRDVVTSVNS